MKTTKIYLVLFLFLPLIIIAKDKVSLANEISNVNFKNKIIHQTIESGNIQEKIVWDWLQNFWDWLASPFRPVWGEYTVKGQNDNAPLVLFKRSTFQADRAAIIAQIQIAGNDFRKIYEDIYDNATQHYSYTIPSASWGGNLRQVHPRARFAKNAAFVALIGVDDKGDSLNNTLITQLKDNAFEVLLHCNANMGISHFKDGDWGDAQFFRSQELMDYLIAFELLRTVGYTWGDHEFRSSNNPAYHLKEFTHSLYTWADQPFNTLSHLLNSNLTEITGSALVMASIILHKEEDYLLNIRYHPKVWAKKGHCRIRQSEFTGVLHSQSKLGGVYGHQEGPGYYTDALKYGIIPMATAFFNFTDENINFSKVMYEDAAVNIAFAFELIAGQGQKITNYFYDPAWKNTFTWYKDIVQPNGSPPSYDDTRISAGLPTLACTKDPSLSFLKGNSLINALSSGDYSEGFYDDRADFIAANNPAPPTIFRKVNVINRQSGDIVFRTPVSTPENEQHYIHLNTQNLTGIELLRQLLFGNWDHLHPSAGNITINCGNEILLLDPPYYGYPNRVNVNQGNMHNVVTVNRHGPSLLDYPINLPSNVTSKSVGVSTFYTSVIPIPRIIRYLKVHEYEDSANQYPRYYYEVIDKCDAGSVSGYPVTDTFTLNLNGNGNIAQGTCDTSRVSTGEVIWSHPCEARGTWKLYAHTSVSNRTTILNANNDIEYAVTDGYRHGNADFNQMFNYKPIDSSETSIACNTINSVSTEYATHARFTTSFCGTKGTFHTILFPLRCDETSTLGSGFRVESKSDSTFTVSTLLNLGKVSCTNIHIQKGESPVDTITIDNCMFNADTSYKSKVRLIGDHAFLSISKDSTFIKKNCVSYTKFRKASMSAATYLSLNDTVYLSSDTIACDAGYQLTGRFRYRGNIQADTACTVNFYLPDVDMVGGMSAISETEKLITNVSYNSGTKIISITVDTGLTEFFIEPSDPCYAPCFFPPATENIKDTFDFYEGTMEHLAHDLTILPDTGWLMMSNGSKAVICPHYMLVCKDSITMVGLDPFGFVIPPPGADGDLPASQGVSPGTYNIYGTKRTMIVVMDKAALILDSGSYCHVGVNSTLLIQKGGTLLVRRGATLEIGSGHMNNWPYYGEVIAEDSSFVCIEDSSDVHFYINHSDSSDKNIFFISFSDSMPAIDNVNTNGIRGNFNQNDIYGAPGKFPYHNCIEFCDLKVMMPPDGVNNKIFGWCNVNEPKAEFKIKPYFCLGGESDTPYIYNTEPSLNEVKYRIEVMTGDTMISTATRSAYIESGFDTLRLKPEQSLKFFQNYTSGIYFVRLIVINSCGERDTASSFFTILGVDTPAFHFTDTNICPGFGTLTAIDSTNSDSILGMEKFWHVHLIDTTQYQENDTNIYMYGGDWQVPLSQDTFKFDSLRWLGGFRYAISLTYRSFCGELTTWDTVEVEPGAYILASPATVYSDPLGPSSLQLNAYIGQATSFSRSPTTYLDYPDSLNPIATPTDTITYILTTTKDNCYAYDTLFIMHNNLAFAGVDSVVCAGSKVLTGPNYDAALLFAILKLQGGNDFQTLHDTYYNNDSLFFNDLSLFMITETGKNDMNVSGCTQLINYYDGFDRAQFYEQSWFITFYNKYIEQSSHADAFDYFATAISNNPTLSTYLQNNRLWDDFQCINNMLIDYYNYKQNTGTNISSTWDVYENDSWTNLPDWNNYIKTIQTINSTTTFKLTVIDNPNGVVEYDQVTYTADTVIQPFFTQLFQTDSTIYFSNISEPVSSTTEYLWSFGDGDSSTEVNPIHTFAAFDSAYVVTLSATNKCGTETWSDTVSVDSSGIFDNLFTIKTKPGLGSNNNLGNPNQYSQLGINKIKQKGITCMSFPNPFDDKTTFIYQIDFPFAKGQLVVNNTLGQSMGNFDFSNNKGVIPIQTEHYAKGMYFYTLFIDGSLVQTGKWMKE